MMLITVGPQFLPSVPLQKVGNYLIQYIVQTNPLVDPFCTKKPSAKEDKASKQQAIAEKAQNDFISAKAHGFARQALENLE